MEGGRLGSADCVRPILLLHWAVDACVVLYMYIYIYIGLLCIDGYSVCVCLGGGG